MYIGETDILDMFFMPQGTGEIFDLSSGLPLRLPFAFGGAEIKDRGTGSPMRALPAGCVKKRVAATRFLKAIFSALILSAAFTADGVMRPALNVQLNW